MEIFRLSISNGQTDICARVDSTVKGSFSNNMLQSMQVKILLYFRYMRMNVAASDQHKQYDALVPKFLHNRPKTVVQHCMRRWFNADNSTLEDVDQVSSSQFLVKSLSEFKTALCCEVCFENDSGMPSCQCLDWINNHLPCKHFIAVFHHFPNSWDLI